ncbi:AGAP005487-PA [Anopheles gambiae str. PEST]|uniref:AGAP005487-PA n=1 Tax=Anopheles gambiae TaxID=7165 RepID=Q5TRM8_ANOGA|nr:AGAP005487-PA [Anopheles gambiae str. PEST]
MERAGGDPVDRRASSNRSNGIRLFSVPQQSVVYVRQQSVVSKTEPRLCQPTSLGWARALMKEKYSILLPQKKLRSTLLYQQE